MRRRDFFSLVGGVVVAAVPRFARSEQVKVYHLAVVHPSRSVSDMTETGSAGYRAFFQRLHELGYVEGQNLSVERYSGEGQTERFAKLTAEVIRGKPDVIFAVSMRLTRDFKTATDTIPVVAMVTDPLVDSSGLPGIVSSLARPGGNITCIASIGGWEIATKSLQLLREMVPSVSKVGYLVSRRLWEYKPLFEAAQKMKVSIIGPPLDPPLQEAEYRRVFAAMTEAGADALFVSDQSEHWEKRRLIVELAEAARLPAIYPYPEFAGVGGLMAYGADNVDLFRHAADPVDQILKGTKPGDIPFYQPTKFPLVINIKTAKAIGLTVPPSLLIAADEVIE
jgi:putative ABC transport system substrate-binding protein